MRAGSSMSDYLCVVSDVSYSGKPNYLGCRIQLQSDFNLALWDDKLRAYEDSNVVNFFS